MDAVDPRDVRLSDADRDRVLVLLRTAAGDGRLYLEELEARVDVVLRARTYGDLLPATADLTATAPGLTRLVAAAAVDPRPETTPVGAQTVRSSSTSFWRTVVREGVWDVDAHHHVEVRLGRVLLDLRRARFPAGGLVTVEADVVGGRLDVVVGYGTRIEVSGRAVAGAFREHVSRFPSRTGLDSPLVRVVGTAHFGTVEVGRIETSTDRQTRGELRT